MIFNMVGGGSNVNVFAVINAAYPEGSICTCTNGQKTLIAKDTTGTALFLIPSGGDWTVTASSGDQTKSKTISVEQGKTYNIEILYEFLLYLDGNEFTEVTGGWTAYGKSRKNATTLDGGVASTGGTLDGLMRTANKVDLTNYSSITFYTESVTGSCIFGIHSNASNSSDATTYLAKTSVASATVGESYTVDVSNLSGEYYISFGNSSSSALRYARVNKVAMI